MHTDSTRAKDQNWLARFKDRRRAFLLWLSGGLGAAIAALIALPGAIFSLAPLLLPAKEEWRDVGAIDEFKPGTTRIVNFEDASPAPWAGVTAKTAAWVRREDSGDLVAFSVNCTHLGCPVRWLENASLFMCPCHGGVYYADGKVAAGPPPKPLPHYPVRSRAGRVEVRTSPVPITTV